MATENVDVAIIGAGWYGLVAARTYLRFKPEANVIIIDSDNTVGGVWSKERLYPGLVAQVRLGLFNYSDMPMEPGTADPKDTKVTGEMIHAYLDGFARKHDLLRRIRFDTFVCDARQLVDRSWQLCVRDSPDTIRTQKLLVATGVTSIPRLLPQLSTPVEEVGPEKKAKCEQKKNEEVPWIHSRDLGKSYQRLADASVRDVVVVGAAKSAYDAVYLMLSLGKKVTWVIRREGGGPLSILPTRVLGVVHSVAFASTRLMSHLSPSILNAHGPMYRLTQGNAVGRWCVGRFWDFLDFVSRAHAGYASGDHVSMLKPEIGRQGWVPGDVDAIFSGNFKIRMRFGVLPSRETAKFEIVFWASSGLGIVTLPDFWKTLHGPNLTVVRDVVASVAGRNTVVLGSGTPVRADYLITCTGWGDHFGMFDAEHKALLGLPPAGKEAPAPEGIPGATAAGAPTDIDWTEYDLAADETVDRKLPFLARAPTVAYPALLNPTLQARWRLYLRVVPLAMAQRRDRSVAILGQIHTIQTPLLAEVQTLWAVAYLLGEIDLPDLDAMATEVALWNAWTRKRYLHQGQKFPYSLYDFLPYIDRVFRDLGLDSRRKSDPISELLAPYEPSDFNGFVDEYLAKKRRRRTWVVQEVGCQETGLAG